MQGDYKHNPRYTKVTPIKKTPIKCNVVRKFNLKPIMKIRTIEYSRKPTTSEIKFGHGATHYKDFDVRAVTKKDGSIKKRLKCPIDGLIYTQNYAS